MTLRITDPTFGCTPVTEALHVPSLRVDSAETACSLFLQEALTNAGKCAATSKLIVVEFIDGGGFIRIVVTSAMPARSRRIDESLSSGGAAPQMPAARATASAISRSPIAEPRFCTTTSPSGRPFCSHSPVYAVACG